ncbi:MAG: radical SAM protein [Bacteroidetes bacterium]|nr:radical SAM protein [Bacteroidota bacterium]
MTNFNPVYIKSAKSGKLNEKKKEAFKKLAKCTLCPRNCKVNRLEGETGVCKTGIKAWVSSYSPHFGEEAPLVGYHGSGTIFFTHCNLLCNFCQNYDISHEGNGVEVTNAQLATFMLQLQKIGCHNINFVTPSHVIPQILSALELAVENGLSVPLIYNTSAYDSVESLKLLDGVIDIYMPDFKFWDSEISQKICKAKDYPEKAKESIKEMHRQVGDFIIDENGIAKQGLLVRHLVLPQDLANTRKIMRFIYQEISPNTYVNIMPQYRPCGLASEIPELSSPLSQKDYTLALQVAKEEGITRLD